jgi:toxin YoeB
VSRRAAHLHARCLEDLTYWVDTDARVATKALALMQHCLREPFAGLGKPEPLKALGSNVWSRRLTAEHRLVYVVHADRVEFVQCRYHY